MIRSLCSLLIVLMLAACSAQSQTGSNTAVQEEAEQAKVHPNSGLAIIDVTVISGGKEHIFRTEVAQTPQQQARGMMFRTEMGDNEAMLFPAEVPAPRSFWMKNTPLSLDIIFIAADGKIANIAERTEPYSEKSNLSNGPVTDVLELRGGRSQELGIAAGDTVTWTLDDRVSDAPSGAAAKSEQ
jgi:uncharacterized membrane protein (UPF0127 family)